MAIGDITFEQHFVKEFIPPNTSKVKESFVFFNWKISIDEGGSDELSIVIDTTCEWHDSLQSQTSKLVNNSLFTIDNVGNRELFTPVLEQLFYKAYDSMLKAFNLNYKNTYLNFYEPVLPLDLSDTITDVLNTLPWSE